MRVLTVMLLTTAASLVTSLACAEPLRGDAFITAMNGNTLSGKNAEGADFHVYFVPGGEVTYEDTAGKKESGKWELDGDSDVCVTWLQPTKKDIGCFKVSIEGRAVTWEGKTGVNHGGLRGEVAPLNLATQTP